jgi:Mn-containing catalase
MFLRIDKLQIELPKPDGADPTAAGTVQELLGGKFGEMSTLMNYTYQSFNLRGKSKVRPYYDLIANIAAEEMGHIELVANTINLLLDRAAEGADGASANGSAPLGMGTEAPNPDHFINTGLGAVVAGAGGAKWSGDYVFNSGNLKLDLLHNFFLESGARMGKIRVYEMTDNPVAREMVGYLIVRGGVHQEAYAKALSDLSGVDVTKLLPVPEIDSMKFPHARKYIDQGFHRKMYRFSPDDYRQISEIWNGSQVDTGEQREVVDGIPEGGEVPDLTPVPPMYAPSVSAEDVAELARKLG